MATPLEGIEVIPNAIANALSPLYDAIVGGEKEAPWEYRFGEPGYRENISGYYPAAPPLGVTDPYTETYRSDILPRTEEDFTKVITGPSGKYVQGYDVGAGPFAQLEQELLARHDERRRQADLNIPTGYYTGATIKRYGDLGTLEETINAPRIDIYPDDRTVFSGGVRQVIEPSSVADALRSDSAYPSQDYGPTSGYLGQFPSSPALQDTTQAGYMQQGAHPWSALLGALYGEEIGTTPHLGGVVWERGDEGAWTGRPPERFLDYPGDTPEERVQEQRDMLALQREMTGYVPPTPLSQIFRGDTGVGTDLQFTPEEAMTSNISNALIDYAYDRDVQPELQAITQLAEVDPTFNFEKYLDPASQEVMDITTQEESFSAIQEADQQRMERESRAAEASARQDRERQEKAAADARKAEESARRSQQEHEARANRIRKEASARDRQIQEDDRKAIARANADAERARNKEREEAAKRRQAVEAARLNKLAEAARKQQEAEQKRMDDLLAKQMEDMMRSMEEARRRRYTGGTGGALMWT